MERDWELIKSDLMLLNNFEGASLNSRAFGKGEDCKFTLTVSLINGKNLPAEDNELRKIAKKALKIVTNSISNEEEFHYFNSTFVTKEKEGVVTKRKSVPFKFALEELR